MQCLLYRVLAKRFKDQTKSTLTIFFLYYLSVYMCNKRVFLYIDKREIAQRISIKFITEIYSIEGI